MLLTIIQDYQLDRKVTLVSQLYNDEKAQKCLRNQIEHEKKLKN